MRALLLCFLLAFGTLQTTQSLAAHADQSSDKAGGSAAAPFDMAPRGAPKPAVSQDAARVAPPAAKLLERPVLPFASILLEGETDARTWAFHLTQDEAASRASIAIGFQNSIVVMPEASRLRVAINGEAVADLPIASPQAIERTVLSIRPGLLRSGENVIRLEAVQRHRTDCSVMATYELWTRVDSAATGLIFPASEAQTPRSLDDLPAVGLDTTGITTIHMVSPGIQRPEIRDRLLRLVQLVALRGRYAHPVLRVSETDPGPMPTGTIKVVMGLADELRGVTAVLPAAASTQPLAVVAQEPNSQTPTLFVSGPTWSDLDTAVTLVGGPPASHDGKDRTTVDTASWHRPSMPTYLGKRSVRFADLGIPTQEFSGRRFRTHFAISLPSDFYAGAYGEATLHLDGAHTTAIKPGSYVQVIVNGTISATTMIPIRSGVFDRYPIRITMRNFRPGINHVALEAVLLTEADERCAPEETLSENNRFALFGSTSLDFPDFARIGRSPDLATLSAGAFPSESQPATVVMPRSGPANYTATGTLLARLARDAGEPVQVRIVDAAAPEDRSVIVVGAIGALPDSALSHANVSSELPSLWKPASKPSGEPSAETSQPIETNHILAAAEDFLPTTGITLAHREPSSADEIRDRWMGTLEEKGILRRSIRALENWAEQTYDLALASLDWHDHVDPAYQPPLRSPLFLAQGRSGPSGSWTLVTARTDEALAEQMIRLTSPLLWPQVSGRAAALDPSGTKLDIQPVRNFGFVQTQPFSLLNMRLVAANWMSINFVPYALLIMLGCTLLGITTSLLLNRSGRRPTR